MPPRPTHTQVITPYDAMMARYEQSLGRALQYILNELSYVDVRLSVRTGVGGGQDPFDTSERQSALDAARATLADVEAHPDARYAADPRMIEVLLEQQMLHDFLNAEQERLDRETDSARDASGDAVPAARGGVVDLLAGSILFADVGESEDDVDAHLAWRLQRVRTELRPNAISTFQRDELASRVRDLGKLGPKTTLEVAALLKLLERLPVAPFPILSADILSREIEVYLGVPSSLDGVSPYLERGARAVRAQIDVAFAVLAPRVREEIERRAAAMIAHPSSCAGAAHPRTPREMTPPDERLRACSVVRAAAGASNDEAELAALIVMHEAIVTAQRATTMHSRLRDPKIAEQRWPRFARIGAEAEAAELQLAANHPTKAIAAGVAAALLIEQGGGRVTSRARAWMRFGDARFDVIERYLLLHR